MSSIHMFRLKRFLSTYPSRLDERLEPGCGFIATTAQTGHRSGRQGADRLDQTSAKGTRPCALTAATRGRSASASRSCLRGSQACWLSAVPETLSIAPLVKPTPIALRVHQGPKEGCSRNRRQRPSAQSTMPDAGRSRTIHRAITSAATRQKKDANCSSATTHQSVHRTQLA